MQRYRNANSGEHSEVYEIVQLLRINNAGIERNGPRCFLIKLGPTWRKEEMTETQLKARYGHGTLGYKALRMHQRAHLVPVARQRPPARKHDLV